MNAVNAGREYAERFGVKSGITHDDAIALSFYAVRDQGNVVIALWIWNLLLTVAVIVLAVTR
jgi:hypothetical protein